MCPRCLPVLWMLVAVLGSGCGLGYQTVLFSTNTVIGAEVATTPPSTTVAYKRQVALISPQYPGGYVPAVVATIDSGTTTGLFSLVKAGIGFSDNQHFLTGDAATYFSSKAPMSVLNGEPSTGMYGSTGTVDGGQYDPEEYELGLVPSLFWNGLVKGLFGVQKVEPTRKSPYCFITNTNIGIDIHWSPEGHPRSINLGGKRQELAVMRVSEVTSGSDYLIRIPSLFASFDAGVAARAHNLSEGAAGQQSGIGISVKEVFATGKAADFMAVQPDFRDGLVQPALLQAARVNAGRKAAESAQELSGREIVLRFALLDSARQEEVKAKAHAIGLTTAPNPASKAFLGLMVRPSETPPNRLQLMRELIDFMKTLE